MKNSVVANVPSRWIGSLPVISSSMQSMYFKMPTSHSSVITMTNAWPCRTSTHTVQVRSVTVSCVIGEQWNGDRNQNENVDEIEEDLHAGYGQIREGIFD